MTNVAETTRSLVIERLFPHSPEKLWRALTEKTLLTQWTMPNDFQPVVGHKFQFRSEPVPGWNGIIDCEVLIVDPLKQLSYTWSSMGADFVVNWTLTAEDGGTHLRMEQSGFGPEHKAAYQGATYGWKHFLDGLENVLNGMA
jgi:uncharacterized protein YndB with AHSA1/START domain